MRQSAKAFTLVEILIVVIILAILAGVVLPQIPEVISTSRESTLKENLAKIRAQLEVYENQHADLPAGALFVTQMIRYTDFDGETSDTKSDTHRFGPYLEQMPPNPVTGSKDVRASNDPAQHFPPGDADGGWWYNEITGKFYADLTDAHVDEYGQPYNRF
jgi:general secretion pathway protein G